MRIWGEATGEQVSVSIQGESICAPVKEGRFEALLPALKFSGSETLTVTGDETLVFHDVAVGEVWLAAGQSNMEFQMYFDRDFDGEPLGVQDIRYFGVPEIGCEEALERFDYSDWGFWRKNDSRENLKYFTAVGYYFARIIAGQTGHVVGVINCSWGGTASLPWIDPAYIRDTPGVLWIEEYEKAIAGASEDELRDEYLGNLMSARGKQFDDPGSCGLLFGMSHQKQMEMMSHMPPMPAGSHPPYQGAPGRLFESMVNRVAPYTVQGVLWYQGESDSMHPELYGFMLTGLIRCWRGLWREELPFYLVQLPSFGQWLMADGHAYPEIRQQQEQVADVMEKTFLVSTMDCGMLWDIHPKRKKPVGERLALMALKETYGCDVLAGSPRPVEVSSESGKIAIRFSDAEGGLVWKEELAGQDAVSLCIDGCSADDFWWEVSGEELVIASADLKPGSKAQVKLAARGYDPVNIFNQAGFTLRPFTVNVKI
ncbi:MAG: hypothetical protein J1E06_03995 [Acutalibacter sp.]|nr:hypothetical protein [Acutalibacter sp.]